MGKFVNAHVHLGKDCVFDEECDEQELLSSRKYGVTSSIVQPFINRPYIEDTVAIHNRIAALTKAYPGEFFGMASINPHFKEEDYFKEAERCVRTLKFVGIKITPVAHAVDPKSKDAFFVFETARALGVPVMVHTGSGIPFSDPFRLTELAKNFRSVPLVIAHAGGDMHFSQALYLSETYEQVYLEPSWISILNLRTALKKVGPTKVMFSSDHVINIPVEIAKYDTLIGQDAKALEQVKYKTAKEVFRLQGI